MNNKDKGTAYLTCDDCRDLADQIAPNRAGQRVLLHLATLAVMAGKAVDAGDLARITEYIDDIKICIKLRVAPLLDAWDDDGDCIDDDDDGPDMDDDTRWVIADPDASTDHRNVG